MGTSGAYGGSGAAPWTAAHDAFDALPVAPPSGSGDTGADGLDITGQQTLDTLLQSLATALQREDADHGRTPSLGYPLTALSAAARSSGGGATTSAGPGRTGAGAARQVLKGASRGAAAVSAAYALRVGDAEQLRELGLDLDTLRGLPPRTQTARILQAVLGDAAHPDDAALRRATAKHVKDIVLAETPPSPEDSLRGLVAHWIYELSLVELASQKASDTISAKDVVRKQEWLRDWLTRRVRDIAIPDAKRMTVKEFTTTAAQVTEEALRMLRATRS